MHIATKFKFAFALLFTVLFFGQNAVNAQCDYPSAVKLVEQEKFGEAESCLKKLIAEKPGDEKLYYQLGEVYWETERYPESKSTFEKGINKGSRYIRNYIGLLKHQVMNDQYDAAMETLEKAQELNRDGNVDRMVEMAMALLLSKDTRYLDKAEGILINSKTKAPNNKLVYIGLGDLYHQQGISELPLDNYRKAIELEPGFMKGYLRAGQELKKEGKYNEAADLFKAGIEQNSTYAPLYKEMGEMWYSAGQYEKALENYRKYVELTGNDLAARMRLGSFLFLTENYEEAITEIDKILQDTSSVVMYRIKGYSLTELKKYEEAQGAMDKYFELVKEKFILADDWIYQGKIYLGQKKYTEAEEAFDKALKIDPERGEVFSELGQVYYKQREYLKSVNTYQKMVDADKAKFKEYYYYSTAAFRMLDSSAVEMSTDTARVVKIADDFVNKYPNSHVPHLHKARVLSIQDPTSENKLAWQEYEKVIELMGDKREKYKNDFAEAAGYFGAYFMIVEENCEEACKWFNQIMEVKPNDTRGKTGLEVCDCGGQEGGE